ncbi:MAG: HNH endonuclease, partial [Firmicutes bacterium]|nr:HNH endonuclease [Bacillota bacterium]
SQKLAAFERQNGICPSCEKHFKIGEMEGDHITPWSKGGKTAVDNLQLLCRACNRRKGGK